MKQTEQELGSKVLNRETVLSIFEQLLKLESEVLSQYETEISKKEPEMTED